MQLPSANIIPPTLGFRGVEVEPVTPTQNVSPMLKFGSTKFLSNSQFICLTQTRTLILLPISIHFQNSNPNPNSSSIPNQFHPFSIPVKRRQGRPGSKPPLYQVSSNFLSNANEEQSELLSSSSSGKFSKPRVKSYNFANKNVDSKVVKSINSRRRVVSDEIIYINKESTSEALIALTAGFLSDSLTDEEIEAGAACVVGGIEQYNYILIRNHIITKWRENVSIWVKKDMFVDVIPECCSGLLDSAYNYLLSYGYINFGVALAIKNRILAEPSKGRMIVIGAGLAGLAASRQLMSFGFEVTALEGRKRAGRRVYTKKMEGGNKMAAADLGGSVLTGTLGNPLGLLAQQLSHTLHKVRDKCPLYRVDEKPVDEY